MRASGFKDEADLDTVIKTTDAAIKRARNKELGIEEEEKVSIPSFREKAGVLHTFIV